MSSSIIVLDSSDEDEPKKKNSSISKSVGSTDKKNKSNISSSVISDIPLAAGASLLKKQSLPLTQKQHQQQQQQQQHQQQQHRANLPSQTQFQCNQSSMTVTKPSIQPLCKSEIKSTTAMHKTSATNFNNPNGKASPKILQRSANLINNNIQIQLPILPTIPAIEVKKTNSPAHTSAGAKNNLSAISTTEIRKTISPVQSSICAKTDKNSTSIKRIAPKTILKSSDDAWLNRVQITPIDDTEVVVPHVFYGSMEMKAIKNAKINSKPLAEKKGQNSTQSVPERKITCISQSTGERLNKSGITINPVLGTKNDTVLTKKRTFPTTIIKSTDEALLNRSLININDNEIVFPDDPVEVKRMKLSKHTLPQQSIQQFSESSVSERLSKSGITVKRLGSPLSSPLVRPPLSPQSATSLRNVRPPLSFTTTATVHSLKPLSASTSNSIMPSRPIITTLPANSTVKSLVTTSPSSPSVRAIITSLASCKPVRSPISSIASYRPAKSPLSSVTSYAPSRSPVISIASCPPTRSPVTLMTSCSSVRSPVTLMRPSPSIRSPVTSMASQPTAKSLTSCLTLRCPATSLPSYSVTSIASYPNTRSPATTSVQYPSLESSVTTVASYPYSMSPAISIPSYPIANSLANFSVPCPPLTPAPKKIASCSSVTLIGSTLPVTCSSSSLSLKEIQESVPSLPQPNEEVKIPATNHNNLNGQNEKIHNNGCVKENNKKEEEKEKEEEKGNKVEKENEKEKGHEVEKEKEENSNEENEQKEPLDSDYEELIKTCRIADPSSDMEKLINNKLIKYYYAVHSDFLKSRGFRKIVRRTIELIKADPDLVYYNLKSVVEELKVRKKSKVVILSDADGPTTAATTTTTGNKKLEKQIQKLNKALFILTRRIKHLDEAEVDLDDENSTFLQVERYKKRACEIYDKICDLTGESKNAHRLVKKPIHFQGTSYPQFNKTLQAYVNQTKEFPDYFDVVRILEFCNKEHSFDLRPEEIKMIAQDAFISIGKLLQARRKTDLYETVSHFTSNLKDPATVDPVLMCKLAKNQKQSSAKINSIFEKYARAQDSGVLDNDKNKPENEDEKDIITDGGEKESNGNDDDLSSDEEGSDDESDQEKLPNGDLDDEDDADCESISSTDTTDDDEIDRDKCDRDKNKSIKSTSTITAAMKSLEKSASLPEDDIPSTSRKALNGLAGMIRRLSTSPSLQIEKFTKNSVEKNKKLEESKLKKKSSIDTTDESDQSTISFIQSPRVDSPTNAAIDEVSNTAKNSTASPIPNVEKCANSSSDLTNLPPPITIDDSPIRPKDITPIVIDDSPSNSKTSTKEIIPETQSKPISPNIFKIVSVTSLNASAPETKNQQLEETSSSTVANKKSDPAHHRTLAEIVISDEET